MSYTHLSQDERYQIQHLRAGGFSLREIGAELERAATTIGRELRRNPGDGGRYQARVAQRQSAKRRHAASAQARIHPDRWAAVEARLMAEQWSPVQIASEASISHERIYQHIAADRQSGGKLWRHLRCRKQRRRHRCGTPRQRQRFRGRRIAERPAIVEDRKRVGDWEGDTIVGKGLSRVVTLVERNSGLLRMRRVPNGEADTVMRAIVAALHPLEARVHTLTWDNGSEFAEHALIDIALNAKSYFAEPYSSWQRGTNENTNGLVRQYLPKRCDLGAYSDTEIQAIEDKLNQRPRKRLGFRTPQQVFDASFNRGALRS
ncbi:MAG: IS30 family transposase [Gammaproteobacteria bacterium]